MSNTELDSCNWCGESVPLMAGKPYCKRCLDASAQVCVRCKRPMPSLKYFTKDPLQARCDACTNKLFKEQDNREKRKKTPVIHDSDSDTDTGKYSETERKAKGVLPTNLSSSEDENNPGSLNDVCSFSYPQKSIKKKATEGGKAGPSKKKKLDADGVEKPKKTRRPYIKKKVDNTKLLMGFIPIYMKPKYA